MGINSNTFMTFWFGFIYLLERLLVRILIFFSKIFVWHLFGANKYIWFSYIPPSRSTFIWHLLQARLPSYDVLQATRMHLTSIFYFCNAAAKSIDHVFLQWSFTRSIRMVFAPLLEDVSIFLRILFTFFISAMKISFST